MRDLRWLQRIRPIPVSVFMFGTLLLSLSLVLPSSVVAQAAGAGTLIQHYSFQDPEVVGLGDYTLFSAPFAASIPAGRWFTLQLSGAYARGEAKGPGGATASLSGLTDTEVGIAFPLGGDRAVLTAGATLPTGRTALTLEEIAAAAVVAAELLPFSVTSWGSGGGAGGDLALAFAGGEWGIGLSGGYRGAREYEPLDVGEFAFRPGDQLRFRVAVDREVGDAGTFSLLLGVQHFGDDQVDGSNLFRSGARIEGMVSYAFPMGLRGSALLYGGILHRENGTLLLEESLLEGAGNASSQDLFMGGTNLRIPVGRMAVFLPDAEIRVFRAADGVGQGWVGSAGGSMDLRLKGQNFGDRIVLAPSARYRIGGVTVREGEETSLAGWELGVTLRVETGR